MTSQNYGLIRSLDEFKALLEYLYKVVEKGGVISFDTEGGYLGPDRPKGSLDINWSQQFVCGFSLSGDPRMARYTAVAHDLGSANLPEGQVWELVKPLLEEAPVVAHNAKFEKKNLKLLDQKGRGPSINVNIVNDTMLTPYVLSEWQRVGQKDLVEQIFGHKQKNIQELFPSLTTKQLKCLRFNVLDLSQEVIEYACEDAAWCLALYYRLADRAREQRGFQLNLEHKIMELMVDVELYGAYVDWEGLKQAQQQSASFLERTEKAVHHGLSEMVGRDLSDLNLGSAVQLRDVLYEPAPVGLGLKPSRFSDKTGKPSTDEVALEKFSREVPPIKKMLELREINNLVTRIGKWLNEHGAFSDDSRVHASYGQTIVPTGRFAANEPAIQQCPKEWRWTSDIVDFNVWKDEDRWAELTSQGTNGVEFWAGNFRDFIVAAPGHYLLTYDYSQIELRVLAGMSQEPALLRAFNDGVDIHTLTASKMLGKPVDQISSKDRAVGKAQPLDALVLTPTGFRAMGDLQVGDQVIGGDGHPTKISGVFPQGVKEIYRVEFADGSSTECCAEHLWSVQNLNTKDAPWKIRSLQYLLDQGISLPQSSGYATAKYRIPDRPVVQFEPGPDLPIDPYVLGLLLGDGGFTHTWGPTFCSADPELIQAVVAEHVRLGGKVGRTEDRTDGFKVVYLTSGERYRPNPMSAALRELGLWGKRGEVKFVPEIYLHSSPQNRLAMLQGLLDTDGNVKASGAEFRVASRALAEGVQFITRSLGGFASLNSFQPTPSGFNLNSKNGPRIIWRNYARLPAEFCPFRLTRKVQKLTEIKYKFRMSLRSIEPAGLKEAQCIAVEAQNGQYLTDQFITTHNTQNFALVYGMGPKSLSDRIAVTEERARELYEEYFAQFPSVSVWMERIKSEGKHQGYVETYFGRKMTAWDLKSESRAVYAKGLRVLGNYPIQGGAADYMKIAMVRAKDKLVEQGWWGSKCTIIMNQHDSLTFEVSNDLNPANVRDLLEAAVVFRVPNFPKIVADWEMGQRWGSSIKWTESVSPEWNGAQWELVELPDSQELPTEVSTVLPTENLAPMSATTLVIEAEWLTRSQLDGLMDLCEAYPGTNKVLFRTSGKEFHGGSTELEIWDGSSLSLADQGRISMVIPGAVCKMLQEELDSSVVVGRLGL